MAQPKTDCKEVLAKVYAYLDGEIEGAWCAQIEVHLAACEPCLRRFGFERELKQLIASRCGKRAPAELLQRIRDALEL